MDSLIFYDIALIFKCVIYILYKLNQKFYIKLFSLKLNRCYCVCIACVLRVFACVLRVFCFTLLNLICQTVVLYTEVVCARNLNVEDVHPVTFVEVYCNCPRLLTLAIPNTIPVLSPTKDVLIAQSPLFFWTP